MKIYRARKSDELKRTETIAIRVSPTERETLFRNAEQEHDYRTRLPIKLSEEDIFEAYGSSNGEGGDSNLTTEKKRQRPVSADLCHRNRRLGMPLC